MRLAVSPQSIASLPSAKPSMIRLSSGKRSRVVHESFEVRGEGIGARQRACDGARVERARVDGIEREAMVEACTRGREVPSHQRDFAAHVARFRIRVRILPRRLPKTLRFNRLRRVPKEANRM